MFFFGRGAVSGRDRSGGCVANLELLTTTTSATGATADVSVAASRPSDLGLRLVVDRPQISENRRTGYFLQEMPYSAFDVRMGLPKWGASLLIGGGSASD